MSELTVTSIKAKDDAPAAIRFHIGAESNDLPHGQVRTLIQVLEDMMGGPAPKAEDAAAVKAWLYSATPGISVRVRGNRHYVTMPGETERPESRCNACAWELAARGYCLACGAPA